MQDTPQRGQRSKVRWLVAGLMWAAIAINYIDRTVLSAAAPHIQKEFHLSAVEMGVVMSAFFWSYALLQLPAGILADRFGQKKVLGFAVLWWSLATAVTGLATGFKSLVACAWRWAWARRGRIPAMPASRRAGSPSRSAPPWRPSSTAAPSSAARSPCR